MSKGEYINMAKAKTLCNVCGKEFDMWDEQEDLDNYSHNPTRSLA